MKLSEWLNENKKWLFNFGKPYDDGKEVSYTSIGKNEKEAFSNLKKNIKNFNI